MSSSKLVLVHEAGHAVVAHRLGRPVKAMVWRTGSDGIPYGAVVPSFPGIGTEYVTFLLAGLVATYIYSTKTHNTKIYPSLSNMTKWIHTDDGALCENIASDDISKAIDIKSNSFGKYDPSLYATVGLGEEATKAINILSRDWLLLDNLVCYATTENRSLGRRELQKVISGQPPRWWERLMDKPQLLHVMFEHWRFRNKTT